MQYLFPMPDEPRSLPAIPGLDYIPDYVTLAQQADLIAAIDSEPWNTDWDRRRQPYGATYSRQQTPVRPIPPWGISLIERLHRESISERPFDQVLVNEYLPGQGIALHRDYEPFDRIVVSISLLSACVMDFRRVADGHREAILLEPRSLLVIRDEARYEWEHGIARRKTDRWLGHKVPRARRVSVTFRLKKIDVEPTPVLPDA